MKKARWSSLDNFIELKLLIPEECFKRFGGKRVLQFCNVEISKVFESSSRKKMKKCVWWIYLRKVYFFILYLKIVYTTYIFEWYEFQRVLTYHYPVFSAKILVCLDVFSRNGSQSIRLFSSMRLKISSEICCGSPGIFVNIVAYISCSKIKYTYYIVKLIHPQSFCSALLVHPAF